MTTENEEGAVVILSDDEEMEQDENKQYYINSNGKRVYIRHDQEEDSEQEQDSELEDLEQGEDSEQGEEERGFDISGPAIFINRTLPEDHEPVIMQERDQTNVFEELNTIFDKIKSECIKTDSVQKETNADFAYGDVLDEDTPHIAINLKKVKGPIAFPIQDKDIQRITDAYTDQIQDNCLQLELNDIEINATFEEYIHEDLFPRVLSFLGVDQAVGKQSRLIGRQLQICSTDGTLKLPTATDKNAYATLFMFIPSEYVGGDFAIQYDGEEMPFCPDEVSVEAYYFIAGYNNASFEFNQVNHGHQMALSFSIVYEGDDTAINSDSLQQNRVLASKGMLCPEDYEKSKPYIHSAIDYFKKHANDLYPTFYMLDYTYKASHLTIDQLQKCDKMLANLFKNAVENAGFSMYLGSVEREVEASIRDKENVLQEINQNNSEKEAAEDCPIDEEGISLTHSIVYEEFIINSIFDENGDNLLKHPIGLESNEHPSIIQGSSWYARCKPVHEEYSKNTLQSDTIKYWYPEMSVIMFLPTSNVQQLIQSSVDN